MGSIRDYLDRMVIATTSPDRQIHARVFDYTQVEVSFVPGTFDSYDEERLSHQLSRLGLTTWVAYRRGRTEAYKRSQNLSSDEVKAAQSRPSHDPRNARYEEELNKIEGEGVSTNQAVRIRTVGMMQWTVDVRPGSLRQFGEQAMLAEIHSAFQALLSDREVKIIILKSDYFDLGIPKELRDLMSQLRAMNERRNRSR